MIRRRNGMERIGAILVGLVLSACQVSPVQRMDPESTPVGLPLSPQLPTGIHLQGVFSIPAEFEGHPTTHTEMHYLLYLPERYYQESERRWPLIYFLRGSGDDDYDSGFVMSFGLPEVLALGEQLEDFPFVVVAPQVDPGQTWWSGDIQLVLDGLLDEISATYRVDATRVYLTGVDMGGYGSWHLATVYPEKFAALVSISGSGYWTVRTSRRNYLCRMQDLAAWAIP